MKITRLPLGALSTNCYIISTKESALLVDPSAEAKVIIGKLKDIGLPVDAILLTHTHYDHFGALDEVQAFTGAEVYMSDIEKDWLTDTSKNGSIRFTEEITSSVRPNTLKEGPCTLGAFKFDVIHTPGPSPGSLSYKFEDFIVSGDVLFNKGVGRTDLYGGSEAELMYSIKEKLFKLDPATTVYAGHNIPTTIGDEKENNPYVR